MNIATHINSELVNPIQAERSWKATIIRKSYYTVQLSASSWEEAQSKALDFDIDYAIPAHTEWDMYDLDEVKA